MIDKIIHSDSLEGLRTLDSESVDCVVTSPPYWALRDYGVKGQLGLEATFSEYLEKLWAIFDEVQRVLKPTGTCWVNIGDTYSNSGGAGSQYKRSKRREETAGMKKYGGHSCDNLPVKCLIQIPSRFAIGMCERGWTLRNELIWHKPNCMPSSTKDRFTVDFEKIFFFVKNKKYYFETQYEKATYTDSRKDKGTMIYNNRNTKCGVSATDKRNKRAVWSICTQAYPEAHFAVYPEKLIEPMIAAGCPVGGVVLDPFMGSGTTAVVALSQKKHYIGIELNEEYIKLAKKRINGSMFV